jgi:hypothetical protein
MLRGDVADAVDGGVAGLREVDVVDAVPCASARDADHRADGLREGRDVRPTLPSGANCSARSQPWP